MTRQDILNKQGCIYYVQIKNADFKNAGWSFIQMTQSQIERYLKNKHYEIGEIYQVETIVKKVEKKA